MRSSIRFALAAVLAASAPALAQDPPPTPPTEEAPTKDEVTAQYLKELKAKQGKQPDGDAQASIKRLVEIWKDKEVSDATKKPVPDLLEKYARDDKKVLIAVAAIDAFAEIGPDEGAKPVLGILDKALGAKEPSVDLYGTCLRALKRMADQKKSTVEELIKLLKHKEDDVAAKAADAMVGYKGAPGRIRKEMLEELIKNTEGVFSAQASTPTGPQARRWNIIQHSVMEALKALSGQTFKDPQEARKWFNDHKKDKMWEG